MTPRKELRRFADAMEAKLRANDHKPSWKTAEYGYLLGKLDDERAELDVASDDDEVMDELVDIANYAMMIFDNIERRKWRKRVAP